MQSLPRDISSVDIRNNLLQLTVAIQNTNFEFIEHGKPLSDDILRKFLSRLKAKQEMAQARTARERAAKKSTGDKNEFEREVIEMLLVVKQLVVAPGFYVNERQRHALRQKLGALDKTRRDLIFKERRQKRMDDVSPVGKQTREPSATKKQEAVEYTKRLYAGHKESAEYKTKLKDWYEKQDEYKSAKDMTFKPQLNENRHKLSQKKVQRKQEKLPVEETKPQPEKIKPEVPKHETPQFGIQDFLDKRPLAPPSKFKYTELDTVEEPICVLRIELDGARSEDLKVFENDDPQTVVDEFCSRFNLSKHGKNKLLEQVQEQLADL